MASSIHEIGTDFAFDCIQLEEPVGIQGGAYLSKIRMKHAFLQTPMLMIKSGVVVHDKKGYMDTMWNPRTKDGECMSLFMDEFEKALKQRIYEYRDQWFDGDIDEEDIHYFFQSAVKPYQGKYEVMRILLSRLPKTMLADLSGECQSQEYGVRIYDEEERILDFDDIRENVSQQPAIYIIEPYCVKFTSTSFQVDYHLRQVMVLQQKPTNIHSALDQCLIRRRENGEKRETNTETNETKNKEETPVASPVTSPPPQSTDRQSPQLMDVELDFPEDEPTLSLKHPNQVYYEMYNEARQRAKQARQEAMNAYLEAKHIRQRFQLTVEDDLETEFREMTSTHTPK